MKNSKENKWDTFEQDYKKAMDSKEEMVSPELWNKISQKLDRQEENKCTSWWLHKNIKWTYAAILLIAIGLSWLKFKPEEIESRPMSFALNSVTSIQKTKTNPNLSRLSLSPLIKKVQEVKSNPSKTEESERRSIDLLGTLRQAEVTIVEEKIPNEVSSHQAEQNSIEQEEAVWVRIDIKPSNELEISSKEIESSTEALPKRKKTSIYSLVKQISHVLKGEFDEVRSKDSEDVKVENKIHQVANQYIKTGEIIKLKFQ